MDAAEALARLARMVQADQRPVLSEADLDSLLTESRIRDAAGRLWSETDWTPTWDLDRAAAEGWRTKAAKVAGDFTFSADGSSFSKGEVMARCLQMADQYAARGFHVLTVRDDRAYPPYDAPRLLVN